MGLVPGLPRLTGGVPAHVEIERWLVGAIGRRELAPGDKLPPEADLAARLGVSRMTLRQALGRLEGRGVITRRPGRRGGTFVAEPRIDVELSGWAGFTAELRRAHVRAGARVVVARTVPAPPDVATALSLGYTITYPPTDEPWGVREFHLRHPDGHMFRVSAGTGED